MKPTKELLLNHNTECRQTTLSEYGSYAFSSVEALVRYMHVASGLPVKSTCLREIKRGNFETCPGLTY